MKTVARLFAIAACLFCTAGAAFAATSWYDTAGALTAGGAAGVSGGDAKRAAREASIREDAIAFRQKMDAVVAQYDRISPEAGNLARQCIDASRIVDIAEHPTSFREIVFLAAVAIALIVSLFVTKILASMFKIEIAKLLWIPIAFVGGVLVACYATIRMATKRKALLAAGVAVSAAGAVSAIDPLRHGFFEFVANVLLAFSAWYVPLALTAVSLAGLLFVASLVIKNLGGGGSWCTIVLRNVAGFVAIPAVCAVVFVGIMSFTTVHFVNLPESGHDAVQPAQARSFASFPKSTKSAAAEMARAAEGVYHDRLPAGTSPFGGIPDCARMAGLRLKSSNPATATFSTDSGLVAQVVRRKTGWGKEETAVIFRGTDSGADVREDFKQYFEIFGTRQYDEAAALLRAVCASTDGPIVVFGHSLGGGQAQYALAMNIESGRVRGVGFNSAGLSPRSIGAIEARRKDGDSVRVAASFAQVRMENDPVSTEGIQLGNIVEVPANGVPGVSAHSISALAGAMEALAR